MAKRRPRTWIEIAVVNGGFRNAVKALNWAHSWIHVQVALGHDPSVDEVAEWWNQPRRSAFREQAAFRECFPDLETPAPIYATPARTAEIRRSVKALSVLDGAIRAKRRANDATLLDTGLITPNP